MNKDEQIQQLQKQISELTEQITFLLKNNKNKKRGKGYNKRLKNRNVRSKLKKNLFDEMLEDSTINKEVNSELKTLSNVDDTKIRKKTARANTFVNAKCIICGKEERVSKSLVSGNRYRCNKCCCGK